jgi:hypothetical protein
MNYSEFIFLVSHILFLIPNVLGILWIICAYSSRVHLVHMHYVKDTNEAKCTHADTLVRKWSSAGPSTLKNTC